MDDLTARAGPLTESQEEKERTAEITERKHMPVIAGSW